MPAMIEENEQAGGSRQPYFAVRHRSRFFSSNGRIYLREMVVGTTEANALHVDAGSKPCNVGYHFSPPFTTKVSVSA